MRLNLNPRKECHRRGQPKSTEQKGKQLVHDYEIQWSFFLVAKSSPSSATRGQINLHKARIWIVRRERVESQVFKSEIRFSR